MGPDRVLSVAGGLTSLVLAACAAPAPEGPPPIATDVAVKMLLLGNGSVCESDAGCGRPPLAGACLLGTCFGLLTTDAPAARDVLIERLAVARADVRFGVERALVNALSHPDARARTRVAAVLGLGAVLSARQHTRCEEACTALRKAADSPEEDVAVAARLALARRGDETVLHELLADLRDGTPHLACAAARALGNYRSGKAANLARAALMAAATGSEASVTAAVRRALQAQKTSLDGPGA